ncbi:MAG: hypothetical protein ACRD04_08865 [Terriglobales bacterium]
MYFWRYWRDTRRAVCVYLAALLLVVLTWAIRIVHSGPLEHLAKLRGDGGAMTYTVTLLCAVVMGFVLGNNNVGSEIQKGTGDFLLTRPRTRRYFVWAGWTAGMTETVALMAISALIAAGAVTLAAGPVLWRRLPWTRPLLLNGAVTSVPLAAASLVLTGATIFGLTYLLTVVFENGGRGLAASLGIFFGYSFLSEMLRRGAALPLPRVGIVQSAGVFSAWYLAPRVEIPLWIVLALAFPFATQLVLERAEP